MANNAGRLAGLAALAGAAYMMSKGKDKEKDSDSSRPARPESTETGRDGSPTADKKTKSDVLEAITKPREKANDAAGNQGVISNSGKEPDAKPSKPKADNVEPPKPPKLVSEPSDKRIKLDPSRRDLEAGMSRGTRAESKPASTVSSSEEGMKNYKPRRTPTAASTPSSAPAKTTSSSAPAKTTSSSAPAKTSTVTPDFTPGKVPTSAQAAANRQAVVDKVKSAVSGVSDYVKNFETPAERRSREAKESKNAPAKPAQTRQFNENMFDTGSAMRRGGMVKKMAKGGMTSTASTASKRADGIASRGKTKCKMY